MLRKTRCALLVVDLQIDFCPGGTLAITKSDAIIPTINNLVDIFHSEDLPIIFSRDFHPADHMSFSAQGGIWPPHCVRETKGADFHPRLNIPVEAYIVNKGTERDKEAYSAFEGTDLEQILTDEKVTCVAICGLATDYCVKATALDGIQSGFRVILIKDAVKGVEAITGDIEQSINEMVDAGVIEFSSDEVRQNLLSKKI